MKFVAVILIGCLLSSCAHDEDYAAAFGLVLGAAILTAVIDEERRDHDRDDRRGERWRDEHPGRRDGHGPRRRDRGER